MLEFAQKYLNIPAEELAKAWNGGTPLLNRLLYANLQCLPPSLFVQILDRFIGEVTVRPRPANRYARSTRAGWVQ